LAPSGLTVVDFWDKTYLPFVNNDADLKNSTRFSYSNVFKRYLRAHFGTVALREYKTSQMSLFLTSKAKTLRPRTLATIKTAASAMFTHAVAIGACEFNPIRDARVLGKTLPDGETGAYTLEEIENVISALVNHVDAQLLMALTFFAGLRRSELQGLQWNDIDAEFIHVRRATVRGVVGAPKTKKSARAIPIVEQLRIPLALWKLKSGDGVFLFDEDLGVLAKRAIIPTLEKAGLPWHGYHAGRRGLGTTLRELTGNSNAGRDVLGHTTDAVTKAHYEFTLPAEALHGMKLLESKATGGKQ
jgi:integrase